MPGQGGLPWAVGLILYRIVPHVMPHASRLTASSHHALLFPRDDIKVDSSHLIAFVVSERCPRALAFGPNAA
jgi:hypothetical protein